MFYTDIQFSKRVFNFLFFDKNQELSALCVGSKTYTARKYHS
jgi:hypothetical protein